MTIVALPASLSLSPSPPLARQSRNAMPSRPSQTLSSCCAHTRCSHPRPRKSASCSILTITPVALHPPPLHGRSVRDPKIPIGPAQPNRASSFPWFPPYEAFGRRPRAQSQRRLQRAGVRNPSVKRTLRDCTASVLGNFLPLLFFGVPLACPWNARDDCDSNPYPLHFIEAHIVAALVAATALRLVGEHRT